MQSVVVDSSNRIYVAGCFSNFGNTPRPGLARLRPDGTLQTNYVPALAAGNIVNAVVVLQDENVLVAGSSGDRPLLKRLSPDGRLDSGFAGALKVDNGTCRALALLLDGGIVVAGETKVEWASRGFVTRLAHDGGSIVRMFGQAGVRAPVLLSPGFASDGFCTRIPTTTNATYTVEFTEKSGASWQTLDRFPGDGNWRRVSDQTSGSGSRFYRARVE